tara:strand:- start:4453 stop:4851 length:399 start_codon:yes stop_codon:yes gene_type:complete
MKAMAVGVAQGTILSHFPRWLPPYHLLLLIASSSFKLKIAPLTATSRTIVFGVKLLFLSIYEEERRYACFDVGVSLKIARMIQGNYQIHSTALHAGSAVNANDLSVYPVPILGGKEADDAGNIYWLTNTVVW